MGTAWILGATSAIAQAVSIELLQEHRRFVLVARDGAKVDAVAADLKARGAESVDCVIGDLAKISEHAALVSSLVARGDPEVVLVAYGVLGDQEKAEASFPEANAIFETNFTSTVSLLIEMDALLRRSSRLTLAVISSVAGDRGRRKNYVYGASKAGLDAFLSGLRSRLVGVKGAHVLTIKPGFVDTPMTKDIKKGPLFASPEKVAKGIASAIRARRDVVYVPGFWRLILFVLRSIPEPIFKRLSV